MSRVSRERWQTRLSMSFAITTLGAVLCIVLVLPRVKLPKTVVAMGDRFCFGLSGRHLEQCFSDTRVDEYILANLAQTLECSFYITFRVHSSKYGRHEPTSATAAPPQPVVEV